MFLKIVIYRNVAFTHSNTQEDIHDITKLKKNMSFAWGWAFQQQALQMLGIKQNSNFHPLEHVHLLDKTNINFFIGAKVFALENKYDKTNQRAV